MADYCGFWGDFAVSSGPAPRESVVPSVAVGASGVHFPFSESVLRLGVDLPQVRSVDPLGQSWKS